METSPNWAARDAGELVNLPSRKENLFYNICYPGEGISSQEFLETSCAGLIIGEEWDKQDGQEQALAWFKSSSTLTSAKKLFLEQPSFACMDMGIDPYSLGLWQSQLFKPTHFSGKPEELIEADTRFFRLSSQAYSMAGADDVQELSLLLVSVAQLVSDYEGQLKPEQLLKLLSLEVSLRPNLFRSVAKISSLRLLLEKLFEGKELETGNIKIYAAPSVRYFSTREPWNNMLRLTACQSAALVGGADGIVSLPFDLFRKKPDGERLSRNSTEILLQESFLSHAIQPAEGSFYLDSLIKDLCFKAWSFSGEIMRKGGLTPALRSGWIQDEIERSHQKEMNRLLKRELILTGVNQYALTGSLSSEFPLTQLKEQMDLETWWSEYLSEESPEPLCTVERVVPTQLSSVFENWQFRADGLRQKDKSAAIPVLFENSAVQLKKGPAVGNILGVAGLESRVVNQEQALSEPVLFVASADPDGEFVKSFLHERGRSHSLKNIWVGEKIPEGFDICVNAKTHLGEFFEFLFDCMEDSQ